MIEGVPGILTGAMVFAAFLIIAWIGKRIIALTAPRVRAATEVVLLLSRVFYYSILTFGFITALSTAGLNVNALIAGLGLTGFALGFALKDVLSNLVAGIMLLFYRPFHIGDEIVMGNFEGTIQTIRMRDTILHGKDGRMIIIPNTKLITEVVVNNSTRDLARETVRAQLPAEADVGAACDTLARALENETATAVRIEAGISVKRERNETILSSNFWYDPSRTDAATAREKIVRAVKRAFDEAGTRAVVSCANGAGEPERERKEAEETTEEKPSEI